MHTVILVDADLKDIDVLLGRQSAGSRVVRVTERDDSHALLAEALAEGPAAVHLVAHGAPGVVRLGASPLDAGSVLDRIWPNASGTEIRIHACDVGAGESGRRFLDRLAAATGARVAAASHPVGYADLGGSWILDVTAGPMTTGLATAGLPFAGAEDWPHRLAYRGTASAGNDTLTGDNAGNTIDGLGGNDSIVGGTGTDSLVGGAGNDTLIGGGNPGGLLGDTLNGGLGADSLVGGSGFNVVTYENATAGLTLDLKTPGNSTGEAAGDRFVNIQRWIGSEQADVLIGNDSGVWFWGHGGDDLEYGGAGNDTLESGVGNDTVHGGGGNDLMFGRVDNDQLFGEAGNDTIGGGAGDDLVNGGEGDNVLFGDWGADTMIGGSGNDSFYAGEVQSGGFSETQSDSISGGGGNDAYFIANQTEAGTVRFDGGAGTDTLSINSDSVTDAEGKVSPGTPQIDISRMTLTSVETLALSGSRHHTVTMTAAQANGFTGITGATTGDAFAIAGANLSGSVGSGTGAQLLAGQVQAETVNGVTLVHIGMDQAAGADVTLRLAGGFTASDIHVAGTTVTLGQGGGSGGGSTGGGSTGGGSTGGGSTPGQTLTGTAARDYLIGGAGNDVIASNGGNDYMEGGAGSDSFLFKGGDGWDYVGDFQAGSGGDVLNLQGWSGLSDLGKALATATQEGADTVFNFSATDGVRLAGVSKASLTTANFVFGSGSGAGGGTGSEPGTGSGSGGGTGGGSSGAGQVLAGTSGRDYLSGGSGNDTITGGAGNDYMDGGAGVDVFAQGAADGWDCIGDFKAGTGGDVLDLHTIGGYSSFAVVMSHATQDGLDTTLDFGAASSMRLIGVDHTTLTAANFLFASS
ncbi:DUF4347 domain-containing protein [Azospirillum doebereinerae]|uniref:DUF4347 domain-containing protein n=1 Tax=Azospirillum doebereinerae TaxID=92933 RepID=UPI001EE60ACD|nr:DUF4347 domain-containing protein [Azospirillum doebereinerae]MCG5238221.1 DUF4347 domain-containing protein [Azospirillum doebereinerae]